MFCIVFFLSDATIPHGVLESVHTIGFTKQNWTSNRIYCPYSDAF